ILPDEATIDSAIEINACCLPFVIDRCGSGRQAPNCSHLYDLVILPDQVRNNGKVASVCLSDDLPSIVVSSRTGRATAYDSLVLLAPRTPSPAPHAFLFPALYARSVPD